MAKHDFTSLSTTLRNVADMLLRLASEIEAERDIHEEEIDRIREQIGDANVAVSSLTEYVEHDHEHIDALEKRTERRKAPRGES